MAYYKNRNYQVSIQLSHPEGGAIRLHRIGFQNRAFTWHLNWKTNKAERYLDADRMDTRNTLKDINLACFDNITRECVSRGMADTMNHFVRFLEQSGYEIYADAIEESTHLPRSDAKVRDILITKKSRLLDDSTVLEVSYEDGLEMRPITPDIGIYGPHVEPVKQTLSDILAEGIAAYQQTGQGKPMPEFLSNYCIQHGAWVDLNYQPESGTPYLDWNWQTRPCRGI